MAGKKGDSSGGALKRIFSLLFFAACGIGGFWAYRHADMIRGMTIDKAFDDTIETFETVISPDDLLAKQGRLLSTKQHTFGPVALLFSPHLLIQGKYSPDGRSSHPASMLWDLTDGELVLDTNSFDHTQGFADCLSSQVNADDFRILHLLTRGGPSSKESIIHDLGIDDAIVCDRLESLRRRHLIIINNDIVRIHVESPLLKIDPITSVTRPFVHRQVPNRGSLMSTRYSRQELESLVKAAFGPDLAIRSSRLIYVPIYEVTVNNPDGSIRKTYWNAVSSQNVSHK